jgi:hypothetical protein
MRSHCAAVPAAQCSGGAEQNLLKTTRPNLLDNDIGSIYLTGMLINSSVE